VGRAIVRRLLPLHPARVVIASLREAEATAAAAELRASAEAEGVEITAEWGDIFLRTAHRGRTRRELLRTPEGRTELLEDTFGRLDEEAYGRSLLFHLIETHAPHVVVDCINTATAIAYQNLFGSAEEVWAEARRAGSVPREQLEAHLSTLYLPQLIRHTQLLLEGMRRAATRAYVKIGTSGTGGMGLNVPFTHSEERPSRALLGKASVAGAQSLLLFLMGRTPDAPAIKEIKPSASIAWKRIAYGPVLRGGRPIERCDSTTPVPIREAFSGGPRAEGVPDSGEEGDAGSKMDGVIESVFLDAGENGLFSLSEFETISSLGLMEVITPEEIADAAVSEILGRSTGRDIVGALDGSIFGPTYRGGAMREAALRHMEELEVEHRVRSVAFEMLGPPHLTKLLFEAHLLERLFVDMRAAAKLDPAATATAALELVQNDARLRSDILSVGLPIVLPDGHSVLRGREVNVMPGPGASPEDPRWANRGWVDLRADSWVRWRQRCERYVREVIEVPGAEAGSFADLDVRGRDGSIRPGALAAFVLRVEEEGERIKR